MKSATQNQTKRGKRNATLVGIGVRSDKKFNFPHVLGDKVDDFAKWRGILYIVQLFTAFGTQSSSLFPLSHDLSFAYIRTCSFNSQYANICSSSSSIHFAIRV